MSKESKADLSSGSLETVQRKIGSVQSVPSMDKLTRLMECPVCLDLLAGVQIFQCKIGHHFCEACKNKLEIKTCPTCQSPFEETRNFGLETIADTFNFNCKNSSCPSILQGSEMKGHLKVCEYRPFQCFETKNKDCKGGFVEISEFHDHLKKVHDVDDADNHNHRNNNISSMNARLFRFRSKHFINGRGWTSFIEYDGRMFLFNRGFKNNNFYVWLTLIGIETEAMAYSYEIKIQHPNSNDNERPLQLNLVNISMHSHHFGKFSDAEEIGDIFSVTSKQLKKFCVKDEDNDYHWEVIYEIHAKN